MDNIAKLTHFHNKTAVEDGEASTDKRNEMTWEQYNQRRQQLKKEVNKIKKERSQIYKDQSRQHISAYGSQQKAMKEELINQLKYSRNKNSLQPNKNKHTQEKLIEKPLVVELPSSQQFRIELLAAQPRNSAEASPLRDQLIKSELPSWNSQSRSPSKVSSFSVIDQQHVSNKSEVLSMAERAIVSEIAADIRSQIYSREKSIYSLALKSHMSKKSKRTASSKQTIPKKNFKKALLEKKYNTSNLSQVHHLIQKQNELQVRELGKFGMINFGSVMHERRAETEVALQLIHQKKAFEAIKHSIYREISQPASNPLIEQMNLAALVPRRPAKPIYEDLTSPMENIEIREYEMEESMISEEKEIQTEESMMHYQAIYEAFQNREKTRRSKQESSREREESSSFSRYYNAQEQKMKKSNKAIEEHPQQESHFDENGITKSRQQLTEQIFEQQAKEKEQKLQKIIGDQLFGFFNDISFETDPYFEDPLRKLIGLADKIKYNNKQAMSGTKQRILMLTEQLLVERQECKQQYERLNSQIAQFKSDLAEHLDQNGQPLKKQDKHIDEISRVISEKSLQNTSIDHPQQFDRNIIINKVVIKKLISKTCQLFEHNLQKSRKL